MNKQDMLKVKSCVLRVNIHCDGCKHKVEKKLRKMEGVYNVSINVEQGTVIVSGNVDPAALIKKLEKAGKHAELWGAQNGPIPIMSNQFQNFQITNANGGKGSKAQKGGKGQQKGGFQAPKQQMHLNKEFKDVKFLGKDQKSVKFNLPEDEEDIDFDDFDGDDDGFDDESLDEEFAAHQPPSKAAGRGGHVPQAIKATSNGHLKAKNGGGSGKKGSRFDMLLKGILGKAGGKAGVVGNHPKKSGNEKAGGKNSKKSGESAPGEGKNASKKGKAASHSSGAGGKIDENWSKMLGENFSGLPRSESKHPAFNEMNGNLKVGGGRNAGLMDQMPNFQPVQWLPATAGAMNAGHFQGAGQGNPYNQQYLEQMRMMTMNQQRGNGHGAFLHPTAYMQPAMNYGPPPGADPYTHIFSDENTGSCSVM